MLWIVDASGYVQATYDVVGYPAPAEILERLTAGLGEGQRLVDVPPLGSAYWYAPDGVPVPKPPAAATADKTVVKADESDEIVLDGVPAGATIVVIGDEGETPIEATGEPVALTFSTEGKHLVRILHPGHTEQRIELEAVASTTTRRQRRIRREGSRRHLVGRHGSGLAARASAILADGFVAQPSALAAVAQQPFAEAHLAGRPSPQIDALAAAGGRDAETVAREIVAAAAAYWAAAGRHEALKARLAAMSGADIRRAEVERIIVEAGRADILSRL